VCVLAVLYVLLNPKKSFSQMPVIDDTAILVHNGMQSSAFQRGDNQFFQNWSMAQAKTLFGNSLSDTPNISPCKSKDASPDELLPEQYDWRQQFPHCVQPAVSQGNCSSSYAVATLSMVSDRICTQSNRTVQLAAQEILDCDRNNYGCEGGYATRALNWGKRKGFIPEACYPFNGTKQECDPEEHFDTNECRVNNYFYKVIDYCLAQDDTGIKREILRNGPVIAQMVVYTDFLTYKEGVYHRTDDSFKFNGQQIVKIVGWERQGDGQEFWIVQNSFGADWGENGFVRVLASDKSTGLDFYGLGVAVYPYTVAEYYASQEEYQKKANAAATQETDAEIDLDATPATA
jgi:cathepsin B